MPSQRKIADSKTQKSEMALPLRELPLFFFFLSLENIRI